MWVWRHTSLPSHTVLNWFSYSCAWEGTRTANWATDTVCKSTEINYDLISIPNSLCVSAILTYSANGYVIRHTLYYNSFVVIGQFVSITVCMQMCYVNSTHALRFVFRDWPVCITQLCMQICYVNSTRALLFVLSMIGRFLSDHAVS